MCRSDEDVQTFRRLALGLRLQRRLPCPQEIRPSLRLPPRSRRRARAPFRAWWTACLPRSELQGGVLRLVQARVQQRADKVQRGCSTSYLFVPEKGRPHAHASSSRLGVPTSYRPSVVSSMTDPPHGERENSARSNHPLQSRESRIARCYGKNIAGRRPWPSGFVCRLLHSLTDSCGGCARRTADSLPAAVGPVI